MSNLELNKIAAAVLVAGLIAMVTGKVTDGLYHPEYSPKKRGYVIEGAEEADAGTGAPAEEQAVQIANFMAAADAAKGEGLIKPCATCHTFDKGGANKVGPNLYGILGNKVAHAEGFAYSKAMAGHGGGWDYQNLSEFLTKPAKYIPGTKMAFAGIKKPEDRANVIAFLRSKSDQLLPLPEPVAEEKTPAEDNAARQDAEDAKEQTQGETEGKITEDVNQKNVGTESGDEDKKEAPEKSGGLDKKSPAKK